jgi:hypothetical protein
MPRSSHSATSCSHVSGSGSAPVGLLGKLTATSRVVGRSSATSASRSSFHPSSARSASPLTSAPLAAGRLSIDW